MRSRTSSFAFKDKPRSMREVGAQLGASFVLEGSVLRSGEMLRVHAQLVRVSDDTPLWSRRYDRELKDVFTIQDEISRSVVNELRLKLGTGQRRYNTSSEAYDLYLKALPLRHADPTARAELFKAIELLEQVIAKDPDFAPAYAGLAKTYATLSIIPQRAPEGVSEKMRAAARRALELDPLLAEAYEGMGLVYERDLAWDDADRAFRRALQINPNLAGAHGSLGILLWERGRLPDGLQEMRTAVKLDPLSADHHRELAFALIAAGQYAEALAHCDRALALRPGDPLARQYSGRALMHQGRLNEAIAVFEQLRDGSAGFRAYAYARAGRRAEAEQIAAKHPDWPNIQVLAYAGLGETDRALEALERMAALHDPRVDLYPFFPELASLRDDPRLKEFRRKRGLSWPP